MPKIVDHDAYRQEIIQKAIQLFVEQGYGGLGMRELAKELGISKSALYHYFPSKEAVFKAVVEAVVQSDIAAFDAQMPAEAAFADKLAAFIDYMLINEDWFIRQYLILTEYARMRESAAETEPIEAAYQQYVQVISMFLGITPDESQALYFQLTGVLMQRLFDNRQTDLRAALQWLLDQLNEKYRTQR